MIELMFLSPFNSKQIAECTVAPNKTEQTVILDRYYGVDELADLFDLNRNDITVR